MVNKRGREGASAGAWRVRKKVFSCFTCCSPRGFFTVYGVLDNEGYGVMFQVTIQRLRRYLFVYLSSKCLTS